MIYIHLNVCIILYIVFYYDKDRFTETRMYNKRKKTQMVTSRLQNVELKFSALGFRNAQTHSFYGKFRAKLFEISKLRRTALQNKTSVCVKLYEEQAFTTQPACLVSAHFSA